MVKRLYQLSIVLWCVIFITACQQSSLIKLSQNDLERLTEAQITQINQQSCQQQDRYEVMVNTTHPLQFRLNRLIALFANSIEDKSLNYRIYLNTQPNAWASSNGCIRVTSGLLNNLTDDEVQAVIAHEIGHIALHHSQQRFRHAKSAEIKHHGEIILLVPQTLSWQQELEADGYAVMLLKRHHIDPKGLIRMLDKLSYYQKYDPITHPNIVMRKKHILTLIQR